MRIRLGNFQQQVLDVEGFTLSDYISENKFCSQKIRGLCAENLLRDNDVDDFELDFVSSPS